MMMMMMRTTTFDMEAVYMNADYWLFSLLFCLIQSSQSTDEVDLVDYDNEKKKSMVVNTAQA